MLKGLKYLLKKPKLSILEVSLAKANLLIEVMSLATSIAMLAPNADLLPSAECYAPQK